MSELLQCDPTAMKGWCYVWAVWPHGSVSCAEIRGHALAVQRDRFHLERVQIRAMFWRNAAENLTGVRRANKNS